MCAWNKAIVTRVVVNMTDCLLHNCWTKEIWEEGDEANDLLPSIHPVIIHVLIALTETSDFVWHMAWPLCTQIK